MAPYSSPDTIQVSQVKISFKKDNIYTLYPFQMWCSQHFFEIVKAFDRRTVWSHYMLFFGVCVCLCVCVSFFFFFFNTIKLIHGYFSC